MATYAKKILSGSTNGKHILVTATTNGGAQTIHTAVSGTSSFDEVWLYCYNTSTSPVLLTVLWGGTTEPGDETKLYVPAQAGRVLICDGELLQNSLIIKAYAASASVVILDGFVNTIV